MKERDFSCERCKHEFKSAAINRGTAIITDVVEVPKMVDGVKEVETRHENPVEKEYIWSKCPKCGERVRKFHD